MRAANTGISAVMNANGEIVARLDIGDRGIVDADLPSARAPTPYARIADWALLMLMIASWAAGAAGRLHDTAGSRKRSI